MEERLAKRQIEIHDNLTVALDGMGRQRSIGRRSMFANVIAAGLRTRACLSLACRLDFKAGISLHVVLVAAPVPRAERTLAAL